MPTFKDLRIWQEAHKLMLEIHNLARCLPADERFRKRDQIERSSSSVADNIAEAYTAFYYNEKIKGMMIARKEAGETQNHIEALAGKKYLDQKSAILLFDRYQRVIAGINGFVNYIRRKKGTKR